MYISDIQMIAKKVWGIQIEIIYAGILNDIQRKHGPDPFE